MKTQEALLAMMTKVLAAVMEDLEDAKNVCGGDGAGCEAYRGRYSTAERCWRKCGQCPMDALSGTIEALQDDAIQELKL